MNIKSALPVTAIIPTYNCREALVDHIEKSKSWLPCVAEIIAIDGGSFDGTIEVLHKLLKKYNARIICIERGLYKGWNSAVKNSNQKYTYFSTIGDIINKEGIRTLYNVIESNHLDLVISTPKMINEDGSNANVMWPIHYLKNYIGNKSELLVIEDNLKEILAASFIPESIIGSSASNIYKTEILKQMPFPEQYDKCGDVVWLINNILLLKVGLIFEELSSFCWDGIRFNNHNSTYNKFKELKNHINNIHNNNLSLGISKAICESNNKIYRELVRFESETINYFKIKKILRQPFKVIGKHLLAKYIK